MFVKGNSGVINTDFICAIVKGGFVATKKEQYKKLIELLQPTELGE